MVSSALLVLCSVVVIEVWCIQFPADMLGNPPPNLTTTFNYNDWVQKIRNNQSNQDKSDTNSNNDNPPGKDSEKVQLDKSASGSIFNITEAINNITKAQSPGYTDTTYSTSNSDGPSHLNDIIPIQLPSETSNVPDNSYDEEVQVNNTSINKQSISVSNEVDTCYGSPCTYVLLISSSLYFYKTVRL